MATATWERRRHQAREGARELTMSKPLLARLAGVLYLIVAVCGGFSELSVRSGVKVP